MLSWRVDVELVWSVRVERRVGGRMVASDRAPFGDWVDDRERTKIVTAAVPKSGTGLSQPVVPAGGLEWLDVALLDMLDNSAGRWEFPVLRRIQSPPRKWGQPRFVIRVAGIALAGACWAPGHGFRASHGPGRTATYGVR